MPTTTMLLIVAAWLGLNYLLMCRTAYIALRREGEPFAPALRHALAWPLFLYSPRRGPC
jgi:protein-tyrosine phosphatase